MGRRRLAGAVVGLLRDGGPVGIELDDAGGVRGQPVEQRRLGDQQRGAGIFQHEGQPLAADSWDRAADRRRRP